MEHHCSFIDCCSTRKNSIAFRLFNPKVQLAKFTCHYLEYLQKVENGNVSLRIIILTPPRLLINHVLVHIIYDNNEGTVNGITGFLFDETPCKIFLDFVRFIGYYPAASHTIEVIGHLANSPCTM